MRQARGFNWKVRTHATFVTIGFILRNAIRMTIEKKDALRVKYFSFVHYDCDEIDSLQN